MDYRKITRYVIESLSAQFYINAQFAKSQISGQFLESPVTIQFRESSNNTWYSTWFVEF